MKRAPLLFAGLAFLIFQMPAQAHHPGAGLDPLMHNKEKFFQVVDVPSAPSFLDGLRRRDENFAAEAMQSHLNRVFETIRLLISEKREYFASNSAEVAIRHGVSAAPYRGRDGK